MFPSLSSSWQSVLAPEFEKPYWSILTDFIKREYSQKICFPQEQNIFRAFDMTPFENVKVVILGQDPYHTAYTLASSSGETKDPGTPDTSNGFFANSEGRKPRKPLCAAMGLSFSVPNGSKMQPSLRNIFKEMESDLGVQRAQTDLTDWAGQGVLLLNAVLTVREGEPASHQRMGWENFTDAAIETLSQSREGIVFILWGNSAIEKQSLIDNTRHHIITSPHPSPFSAHRGFLGSRPFSRTNMYLRGQGSIEIVWG